MKFFNVILAGFFAVIAVAGPTEMPIEKRCLAGIDPLLLNLWPWFQGSLSDRVNRFANVYPGAACGSDAACCSGACGIAQYKPVGKCG
ncbi:hypothetical protein N7478_008111 [Penicillium angulare]|uniref:uncharacterized protein n=1 Tax=Penicillium angulare TaxID=116970 RepID=UPI002541E77C|nr:uncharacterized protein N7478_008111 [Penicillium angulare]KAJ5272986.1 hypothetical protein N7478_008111 [Penicillium angulare]